MDRHTRFAPVSAIALAIAVLVFAAAPGVRLNAQTPAAPMSSMPGMGATGSKKAPAPPSTAVAITVNGKTTSFTAQELSGLPQKTVKVHNAHNQADESYTGVALSELIAKAGFTVAPALQQKMLRSYLRAEGTDHYWVLYSLVEVEPSEHTGDVIVATSMDGHGLGADGELKLVSTEDKKPQRWVRNLAAITLKAGE